MLLVRRTRAVYAYRRVLWLLIVRDLKIRYAGSFLGYMWTILDPLLMTGVYWFVFTQIFQRGTKDEEPFIVFLVGALLAWNWFAGTVTEMMKSLISDARLVRSTNIPREIWVLKTVGSKAIEFVFSVPVILFFMAVYHKPPNHYIVLWPFAVVLECILLTGVGLALAVTCVLVRDLQRIVRIILRMGFYFSPVVYGVSHIPKDHHLRTILGLNPMAGIIEMFRIANFPRQLAGWWEVGAATATSFVMLFVGLAIFHRLERAVLKEI